MYYMCEYGAYADPVLGVLGVATTATAADPWDVGLHTLSHRFPGKEDAYNQRITPEFNEKGMLFFLMMQMSVSFCVFVYVYVL